MTEATTEELNSVRMIVYGILNKTNGRWYVGQTTRTFRQRYPSFAWWKTTTNTSLKNAYRHYGATSFAIFILSHSHDTYESLDVAERSYIKQLNSLYPHGYNFEDGGQNYGMRCCEATCAKIKRANLKHRRKRRVLIDKDGKRHVFFNISTFCEKHGLDTRNVSMLFHNEGSRTYMGWHREDVDPGLFTKHSKWYDVIGPDGTEYRVSNAKEFAAEHGLTSNINEMLSGKTKQYRGFYLKSSGVKPVGYKWRNEENSHKKYRKIRLMKDGETYEITDDIREFCASHGVQPREIYTLTSNVQKSTHGFTLLDVELVDGVTS